MPGRRRFVPLLCRASLGVLAVLAGLPPGVGGQERGVGLQFSVGSAGGGVLLSGSHGGRWGARAGVHAMPVRFQSRYGGLDFSGSFPSPSLLLGIDVFPVRERFRLSGGFFLLLEQPALSTGNVDPATQASDVRVGENLYVARRVGRVDARAEGRSAVPWLGVGWGGNAARGAVEFFVDAGAALRGRSRMTVVSNGAERGNPDFQADLEMERRRMESDFDRFRVYPVLLLGVSLPIAGAR